jgi:hypothetical protein
MAIVPYGSCGIFNEPFHRNTKPFRGVFSCAKYSDIDRRLLCDYGMQLEIVPNCGLGRENCRFHRWPISVRKHSIEGNLDHVLVIQLDSIDSRRIRESTV